LKGGGTRISPFRQKEKGLLLAIKGLAAAPWINITLDDII